MPGPPVPEPSLRRLPQYYHFLVDLQSRGVKVVSCSAIGVALQLVPVQVRKDLQFTGIIGKPKVGYPVDALVAAIEALLGWNNANAAFLVGAGNLGTAILGYERFSRFGLQVVAAFDNDPGKIGHLVHGKPVLSLATLAECAQRMNVHMGVITTPSEVAQAVAEPARIVWQRFGGTDEKGAVRPGDEARGQRAEHGRRRLAVCADRPHRILPPFGPSLCAAEAWATDSYSV